jgi:uncharacterized protein
MSRLLLTKSQVRKIVLHAAGLSRRGQFGKGKEAVYKLIDHLGFLQIDSNYIVERAHHHSIVSRIPDYKPEWLDQLQAERRIFEFWTYAAGYLPMRDFRFSLPVKESFLRGRKPLTSAETNLMRQVLDRIGRDGPLMARDFENDRVTKSTGWWDWRPSKIALERLHLEGKLVTTRTGNFQKVYDLPTNVVPGYADMRMPGAEEYDRHVIRRSLKSLGIASLKEIAFSTRFVKNSVRGQIQKMVDDGEVCSVTMKENNTLPLFMLPEYKNKRITLSGDAFILSPFDVLNVFRHRLRDFFNFDYQVECFVPKSKRKYGYFSLPVLIGDVFVARMDSKADRKKRVLVIHNLHFESVRLTKAMLVKVCDAIRSFAKFNQCEVVAIEKSNNKEVLKVLRERLS